jgi:hypothetical protein
MKKASGKNSPKANNANPFVAKLGRLIGSAYAASAALVGVMLSQ